MIINVNIKAVRSNAVIPRSATVGSAGNDLCACLENSVIIGTGEIAVIPTGIAVSPQCGDENRVVGLVFGRSGLGTKFGITLANSVGVIDSDYRGEICVSLINRGSEPYTVHPNDRIAQLVFVPYYETNFIQTDELDHTARGSGGFGSTGLN